MPQLQSITVTDRATPTPVDHVFVPRGRENGIGTVVSSNGTPVGEKILAVSMRQTAAGKYRGRLTMKVPVVQNETINGIVFPKVVRVSHLNLDVTFESTSTTQERDNAIGMFASALGASKVLVNDALVELEGIF